MGDVDVTLVISTDGTSVAQTSKAGVWTRPLTYDGKRLSWETGPTNKVAWTLTLNPDEQSAVVTRSWSAVQHTGIFKRVRYTEAPPDTMPVAQAAMAGQRFCNPFDF